MRDKTTKLLEEAYKQVHLKMYLTEDQQTTEKLLVEAFKQLIGNSNIEKIEVEEMRLDRGDEYDLDVYSVNGKGVVQVKYVRSMHIPNITIISDPRNPIEINPNTPEYSGTKGLDALYNALSAAGARFNRQNEDNAFNWLQSQTTVRAEVKYPKHYT